MIAAFTRRRFLAATGTVTALVARWSSPPAPAGAPEPTGPVYARAGRRGLAPGTRHRPARGKVTLLDGRVLTVSHGACARPMRSSSSDSYRPTGQS